MIGSEKINNWQRVAVGRRRPFFLHKFRKANPLNFLSSASKVNKHEFYIGGKMTATETSIDELKEKIEQMELRIAQAIGFCRMYRGVNPVLAQKIEKLLEAIK